MIEAEGLFNVMRQHVYFRAVDFNSSRQIVYQTLQMSSRMDSEMVRMGEGDGRSYSFREALSGRSRVGMPEGEAGSAWHVRGRIEGIRFGLRSNGVQSFVCPDMRLSPFVYGSGRTSSSKSFRPTPCSTGTRIRSCRSTGP